MRSNSLLAGTNMDRTTNSADDLAILRKICDDSLSREQRFALLESLENRAFSNAEHQVVFESIRFLFSRGLLSPARLAVHLNNRGFPDISPEQYFPAGTTEQDATKTAP